LESLELNSGRCKAKIQVQSHGLCDVLIEHKHLDGSVSRNDQLVIVKREERGIAVQLSEPLLPRTELVIEFIDFFR
jgi:hypothetical protein